MSARSVPHNARVRGWLATLWGDANFLKLWSGQTISLLGTQVTQLALPLAAVLTLGATPLQMGILRAAPWLPALAIGIFAGVWVDRVPRRPLLIVADLGRAVLLASVPVAAVLGRLGLEHLYLVTLLVGGLDTIFRVAYQAFLPALVGRQSLVDANARLVMGESVARVVGPGVGGTLIQIFTAPVAIAIDAISYLVSAVLVGSMRTREPPPAQAGRTGVWSEIGQGLGVTAHTPLLRASTLWSATFNIAAAGIGDSVFLLYVTRELRVEPAVLGLIFAAGGLAAVSGSAIAGRLSRALGVGPTLIAASLLLSSGGALVLVTGSAVPIVAALLGARAVVRGLGLAVALVTGASLVQAAAPGPVLGRVVATQQALFLGLIPLGALAGGWLGESVGLWPALLVSVVGENLAVAWLVWSPVRALRSFPEPLERPGC
ncbi:MAG: MFS transporter [Chloroflexota bacterium]|nr:MFS transporter [Chloroflexota bacterium]